VGVCAESLRFVGNTHSGWERRFRESPCPRPSRRPPARAPRDDLATANPNLGPPPPQSGKSETFSVELATPAPAQAGHPTPPLAEGGGEVPEVELPPFGLPDGCQCRLVRTPAGLSNHPPRFSLSS